MIHSFRGVACGRYVMWPQGAVLDGRNGGCGCTIGGVRVVVISTVISGCEMCSKNKG